MEEQLILSETAKLAKEKGFNIRDPKYWYPNVTQSLLQKWLREVHKVLVFPFIAWNLITWGYNIHFIDSKDVYEELDKRVYHGANYKSYEEALESGLQEALKLIK